MMQGILLIDKAKDWTSFDVVNYIRRIIAVSQGLKPKQIKVGHIGTLDPLATGLLVLVIGKNYTVKAQSMSKLDKVYEVSLVLGETTDSYDMETEIKHYSNIVPSQIEVELVVKSFIGKISQIPPIYSALKVDGKRAYKLARSGKAPKMEARQVEIYSIRDLVYDYPKVTFVAEVSSGTYIRSLVNDIGIKLGTGAYMSDLRRTSISEFKITDAIDLDDMNAEQIYDHLIS